MYGLGEPVYDGENGGVVVGGGQTCYKIKGYV